MFALIFWGNFLVQKFGGMFLKRKCKIQKKKGSAHNSVPRKLHVPKTRLRGFHYKLTYGFFYKLRGSNKNGKTSRTEPVLAYIFRFVWTSRLVLFGQEASFKSVFVKISFTSLLNFLQPKWKHLNSFQNPGKDIFFFCDVNWTEIEMEISLQSR